MENKGNENKKNIIVFTGGLKAGGAEKQSRLLAVSLNSVYKVTLIAYWGDEFSNRNIDFLRSENITLYRLSGNPVKKNIAFVNYLIKIKPDAIINFLPSNNFIGGFWGRFLGLKKIIGSIRTTQIDGRFKHLHLLFSHYFFNHLTVFNSYAGLDYNCKKGFKKSKSIVIQNCIYPIPPLETKPESADIVVLMVSRFEEYKDYFTALEAFKMLKQLDKAKNVKLQLVGIGPLETKIRNWIRENDLEKTISIAINPENINEYYRNASIFLQTSLTEGFSNSIMEAMAYALPIVATDVGDNRYMVHENENGYIVPIKQPGAIVNALSLLLDSGTRRTKMGKKSYDLIAKNYSLEGFARKFHSIIG